MLELLTQIHTNRGARLVLFGLLASVTACDEYTYVSGTVQDVAGHSLSGVKVMMTAPGRMPDEVTTGSDGAFGVGLIGADAATLKVVFKKAGFKTVQLHPSLHTGPQTIRMTVAAK